MAFVKYGHEIGDWVITKKIHSSFAGYFEVGTSVKIIGASERGYDIEDACGNKMYEIGWEV